MEPIVVVLLTFQRTEYAMRTIRAAKQYLRYPDLRWYVADDGSHENHIQMLKETLNGAHVVGGHTHAGGSYGLNVNRAWERVKEVSPLTLVLEDDWELQRELDLTPYADLLLNHHEIGMVRLGYLNLNMSGRVIGYNGHLYWKLDRDADPYTFTGHPSLRHRRFWDTYGTYPINLDPGKTELAYAWQFRQKKGPEIVWPASLGEHGVFGHIGAVQSYA